MSTELKDTELQMVATPMSPNGETPQPAAGPKKGSRLDRLRQPRAVVATTVVIVLVIASVVGYTLLARQYTPDGAARSYIGALQSGDSSTAWDQVQVEAPSGAAVVSLTDRNAMVAALAAGRPDIKTFTIDATTYKDSSTAIVSLSYATSSGGKQAQFVVVKSGQSRFGIFPIWRVLLTPTLLQVTLPAGIAAVSIDSKQLNLQPGKSTVAVLPVSHKVGFAATQMLAASTVSVDAFFSSAQVVTYTPQLTTAGLAKAKTAVTSGFTSCTRLTSANGNSTCPQDIAGSYNLFGQWSLVGDPTADMSVSFDQDMNASAAGHYQMVFAYSEDGYSSLRHMPAAGGYSAALTLSASNVTVSSINAVTGLPPLTRPAAATDQAAGALVTKALARCSAATNQNVADCPQQLGYGGTTSVHWSMSGDPLAGATVTFDPNSGLLTVHGSFKMSATFVWLGTSTSADSATTSYNAYLLWDGQALQLVTIDGAYY